MRLIARVPQACIRPVPPECCCQVWPLARSSTLAAHGTVSWELGPRSESRGRRAVCCILHFLRWPGHCKFCVSDGCMKIGPRKCINVWKRYLVIDGVTRIPMACEGEPVMYANACQDCFLLLGQRSDLGDDRDGELIFTGPPQARRQQPRPEQGHALWVRDGEGAQPSHDPRALYVDQDHLQRAAARGAGGLRHARTRRVPRGAPAIGYQHERLNIYIRKNTNCPLMFTPSRRKLACHNFLPTKTKGSIFLKWSPWNNAVSKVKTLSDRCVSRS